MRKIITLIGIVAAFLTACTGKAQTAKDAPQENSKTLVAYFSCTGHTEKAAKVIASEIGAKLYRITPQKTYTEADLNWHNDNSRSSVEMKDEKARPALADKEAGIEKYDTIYLGYPIWWNLAPRIINTFLESYHFEGKTVIPFVTSGSSDITNSENELRRQYPTIHWQKGKRFSGDKSEILEWLKQK